MKRRDHAAVEDARRELGVHGYTPLHQAPHERATRWRRPKGKHPEFVIQRETRARSTVWHIVPAELAATVAQTQPQLELLALI